MRPMGWIGEILALTGTLPRFRERVTRSIAPMANIKSQKKRNITNEKRRLRNKGVRSELKTRTKVARAAVTGGDENATSLIVVAQKRLAKAGRRGVIHKNQAARRTSRLMKAANKANASN